MQKMDRSQIRLNNTRRLIDECGGAANFAQRIGISDSQVSQFAGKNPIRGIGNKVAERIEKAFGKTAGWLDQEHSEADLTVNGTGTTTNIKITSPVKTETESKGADLGQTEVDDKPPGLTIIPANDMRDAGYVLIPKYSVKAGMGNGQLITEENVVNSLAFSMGWLTEMGIASHRLAIISVIGDSMEPTLRPGDNVLIDTGSITVRGDAIYVINYDGELLAKRLQKLVDGTLIIMSDNPAYKEQRVSAEQLNLVRVIGRVVWAGRRF